MWKQQVFFLLLSLLILVLTHNLELKGDVVLKILPKTDTEVEYLKKLFEDGAFELDIWREVSHANEHVDVHVPAKNVEKIKNILKSQGISFTEMIHDLAYAVEQEAISNQKNAYMWYDYNKYNRYNEIKSELSNLASTYRGRAETFSVGNSHEGRDIVGIKITNGNRPGLKPVIWIDGGIHAREWISPATVMWFIRYLLTDSSSSTKRALEKYDFYLLPVFNVDGYEYTHRGGRARMWRKTRKPYGWRCIGADPNRNWGYMFGGEGTSSNPCSDTYHGGRAFSEVEVANVARYLRGIRNLKAYFNVHAYSQLVLTPWSYTSRLPNDYNEIERVGKVFANTVSRVGGAYYRVGPPSRYLYNAAGGSIDWTYKELGVTYSYALELRDTGRYGFVLPTSYIRISGKETSAAFVDAALAMR